MYLTYKRIGFVINLSKKVNFTVPVPFLFRSIIGYQLRKMCCIAHNAVCAECMFNATCIYSVIFESIVPKNNIVVAGRDRISHPVIIDTDNFIGEQEALLLNLVFLGSTIPYFPYFYHAIKMGGESGIGRERVPYQVSDIVEYTDTGEKHSLMTNGLNIITQIEPEIWEYNQNIETLFEKKYIISLVSPLRFKAEGQYVSRLAGADLARCFHRRARVLCSQYGRNDRSGVYTVSGNWTVAEQDVKWRDFVHYSARQKKAMRLGGLVGNLVLSGKFSLYECGLLQFAERFHAGKNTNFGLGKLKVEDGGL
jgi:hypothetical protein